MMKKVMLFGWFMLLFLSVFSQNTARLDSITHGEGGVVIKYFYSGDFLISKSRFEPGNIEQAMSPFTYYEYYFYDERDNLIYVKSDQSRILREYTYNVANEIATEKRYSYAVSPEPETVVDFTYGYDLNGRLISKTNFDVSTTKYQKYKYVYHPSGTIASVTLEKYFDYYGQPGTTPEIKDMERWIFEENSSGQIVSSRKEQWSLGGQVYWQVNDFDVKTNYDYDDITGDVKSYSVSFWDSNKNEYNSGFFPFPTVSNLVMLEGYSWQPINPNHLFIQGIYDITTGDDSYVDIALLTDQPIMKIDETQYHYTLNSTVGVQYNENLKKSVVYPNPARDKVMIKGVGCYTFKLYDSFGKLVSESTEVEELDRGVYFYEVESGKSVERGKLILE